MKKFELGENHDGVEEGVWEMGREVEGVQGDRKR